MTPGCTGSAAWTAVYPNRKRRATQEDVEDLHPDRTLMGPGSGTPTPAPRSRGPAGEREEVRVPSLYVPQCRSRSGRNTVLSGLRPRSSSRQGRWLVVGAGRGRRVVPGHG